VRQIDDVGRGLADIEAVDLVLELFCQIVAAIGAGRLGGQQRRES
jgi:hypothetical protein